MGCLLDMCDGMVNGLVLVMCICELKEALQQGLDDLHQLITADKHYRS